MAAKIFGLGDFKGRGFYLWISSLVLLTLLGSFTLGFLSSHFGFFPSTQMRKLIAGFDAAKTLVELRVRESANEIPAPFTKGGVSKHDPKRYSPGNTLITLYRPNQFGALLINSQGEALHEWRIPFELAELARDKETNIKLKHANKMIHGCHVYGNGDFLFNVAGSALLKIDKNSRLIWHLNRNTHHALDVAADGSIWVLGRTTWRKTIPNIELPVKDDLVLHVSSDGKVMEEFSLMDVLIENKYEGLVYGGHPWKPEIDHNDPLHTNDIQVLSEDEAAKFPNVESGELMVSMRTIDTVLVLDPSSKKIKWSITGPFLRQHDPEIDSNGDLLVYDNRTAFGQRNHAVYLEEPQAFGYSRIIKIDPKTRNVIWEYSGSKEKPFYSSTQGEIQPLPNGNVLFVEPEGGRILEVDPTTNDIVWEYVNLIEDRRVGRVTSAIRIPKGYLKMSEVD